MSFVSPNPSAPIQLPDHEGWLDAFAANEHANRSRAGKGSTILWQYRDADPEFGEVAGEKWLVLLPNKWNPSTHRTVYSWHLDPRELGAAQAPATLASRASA